MCKDTVVFMSFEDLSLHDVFMYTKSYESEPLLCVKVTSLSATVLRDMNNPSVKTERNIVMLSSIRVKLLIRGYGVKDHHMFRECDHRYCNKSSCNNRTGTLLY